MVHVHFLGIKCNDDSFLCNQKQKKKSCLISEHCYAVGAEEFRLEFSKETPTKSNTVIPKQNSNLNPLSSFENTNFKVV